jgi:hypothetical protein
MIQNAEINRLSISSESGPLNITSSKDFELLFRSDINSFYLSSNLFMKKDADSDCF